MSEDIRRSLAAREVTARQDLEKNKLQEFSKQATEGIITNHGFITEARLTLREMREAGNKFWGPWQSSIEDFPAGVTQITIFPNQLLLQDSKTLDRQTHETMAAEFVESLGIPDVIGNNGSAPHWSAAVFAYLKETGILLLSTKDEERWDGKDIKEYKDSNRYVRTTTFTSRIYTAVVGQATEEWGLSVREWGPNGGGSLSAGVILLPAPSE